MGCPSGAAPSGEAAPSLCHSPSSPSSLTRPVWLHFLSPAEILFCEERVVLGRAQGWFSFPCKDPCSSLSPRLETKWWRMTPALRWSSRSWAESNTSWSCWWDSCPCGTGTRQGRSQWEAKSTNPSEPLLLFLLCLLKPTLRRRWFHAPLKLPSEKPVPAWSWKVVLTGSGSTWCGRAGYRLVMRGSELVPGRVFGGCFLGSATQEFLRSRVSAPLSFRTRQEDPSRAARLGTFSAFCFFVRTSGNHRHLKLHFLFCCQFDFAALIGRGPRGHSSTAPSRLLSPCSIPQVSFEFFDAMIPIWWFIAPSPSPGRILHHYFEPFIKTNPL